MYVIASHGHVCAGSGWTGDSLPVRKNRTGFAFCEVEWTLYGRLSVRRRESLVIFIFQGNGLELALCRYVTVVSAGVTFAVMATVAVAGRWTSMDFV